MENRNDKWLEVAMKLQSLAQNGLAYCNNPFDKERYEQIREIAADMLADRTDLPVEKIRDLFCCESGYQTPKVDTRAAVFKKGKILLVHEKNGTWSLPGGWCDANQSVASNAVKEVKEESGMEVRAERLIAVQDWRRHNVTNYVFGVVKIFVLCRETGGKFEENIETTEVRYFGREELPKQLAEEKNTRKQIEMCFDAYQDPDWKVQFD